MDIVPGSLFTDAGPLRLTGCRERTGAHGNGGPAGPWDGYCARFTVYRSSFVRSGIAVADG